MGTGTPKIAGYQKTLEMAASPLLQVMIQRLQSKNFGSKNSFFKIHLLPSENNEKKQQIEIF